MVKFFERCRVFIKVLIVICVIISFPVFSFFVFEFKELIGGYVDIEYLLFIGLLTILLISLASLAIAMKLVIKDAQEDISAAMNYKKDDMEKKCKNQSLH